MPMGSVDRDIDGGKEERWMDKNNRKNGRNGRNGRTKERKKALSVSQISKKR